MTSVVNVTSGWAALVSGVRDFFADQSVTANVLVGYRELPKQLNQGPGGANRVVFLPGDPNGAAGKVSPPRDVGWREVADPADDTGTRVLASLRCLATWERQFTISIWAQDETNLRDELLQVVAVETLFERVVQGVEHVSRASGVNCGWGSAAWMPTLENTRGAEIRVGLALYHPFFDVPADYAYPGFTISKEGSDE